MHVFKTPSCGFFFKSAEEKNMNSTVTYLFGIEWMISTCVAIKKVKTKALTWGGSTCALMGTSLYTSLML